MSQDQSRPREEQSLDPAHWDALRDLGHEMLDEMMTFLETVRERPLWQPMPEEVQARFQQPLPMRPQELEKVYDEFLKYIVPYTMGNIHPRFWGWVIGTGSASGMLAEMLTAALNPNAGGGNHSAIQVERQVLDWCKAMLGYPNTASGLLVTGGSMANLVGLTVARNARAGYDLRRQGVSAAPRPMTMYGSQEMHSSIQKAVELLGMGSDSLRLVPVQPDYRIDVDALEAMLARDRIAGYQPICVIGNAGTVNTGAIDDLSRLADLCEREGLWFHVDGAFGALAALSPELRPLLAGMERADSLAFDLHKWMYMPYDVGCILIRSEEEHRRAFALSPDYLKHAERGLAAGSVWFGEYGPELSRSFRALKVWMLMKEHGIEAYGRLVQQNVEQARYLADLIRQAPELELSAPVPLNIVCFRYIVPGLDGDALNQLNQELMMQLHEQGIAAPSYTTLDGKYVLRVAITNHRSRREDFDLLVQQVRQLGRPLAASATR